LKTNLSITPTQRQHLCGRSLLQNSSLRNDGSGIRNDHYAAHEPRLMLKPPAHTKPITQRLYKMLNYH